MYRLDQLDKETAKLRELLQLIQKNKNKADTVWDNFCSEMSKSKPPKKKYFKLHPKTISNSSSEILSPRLHSKDEIEKMININKAKSINNIKFSDPIDNASDVELEGGGGDFSSVEIITLREEYPLRKKITKSPNRNVKSKISVKPVESTIMEKPSQDVVTKKKSSELKVTASTKDMDKDNFEPKMQGIIEKCLNCMEDIRMKLDIGITPPDGMDDLERRKKRSSEFASRFSRNYLYQLNRQLSDIKRLLKPVSARSSGPNNILIKQKLTSSYQTILQGLQAYLTHLPISTTIAVPDKVKELLKEVSTLCDMQRSCTNVEVNSNGKSTDLVDVFEVRSRCLMEKIDEYYSTASVISLLQSQSKFSLLESSKARKKCNIKSRYSMYNGVPSRKDAYWKRAVAALARKKYNVQSKYKTAHFKHRPPVEKQTMLKPATKTKTVDRRSSASMKIKPTIDDDGIKTMMEIEKEKNERLGVGESASSFPKDQESTRATMGDALAPLIGRLVDKLKDGDTEMSQEHIRCLLQAADGDLIGELAGRLAAQDKERKSRTEIASTEDDLINKLAEVIRNYGKENAWQKKEKDRQNDDGASKVVKAGKKERKSRKTVTVTGAKNAQLICIKDESSLIEPLDQSTESESKKIHNIPHSKHHLQIHKQQVDIKKDCELERNHIQHGTSNEPVIKRSCCNNSAPRKLKQSTSNGNISTVSSTERTSKIKISRLPKVPMQPLKMLPKKFALNILEYKINYLKARKGNHMYKKSLIKQPWMLMGEISDKILEELLQSIGSEIEVNDVIEGIYASEFV